MVFGALYKGVANMLFGYARVSTNEQNLDLQIDELKRYGVSEENIYFDKVTGTSKERPSLNKLMSKLRSGDSLVVWRLDRIGRSVKHLVDMINELEEKNIDFISLKENIDTTTPTGKLMFHICSAFAQFERDIISERTKAGLRSARARGRLGGRPSISKKKVDIALKMYYSKDYSIKEILDTVGFSKTTLYRYIKKDMKKKEK
jgi:DNA invertase Pin-like site-specific DNA recombinase